MPWLSGQVDECTVVLCVSRLPACLSTCPCILTDLRNQTDDVGVFGSPLSNEYRLVAQHFGLSESEIRTLARKGIDVIFGGDKEKKRLQQIMSSS